jgi:purine nucleosidase/pyrimidine-specific ribonucleoside hydrolase
LESLPSDGALGSEDAASFIVDSASRYGRQLTIVATGPLTNVATALLRDSAAMSQIDRLAIMGGALSGGNVTDNAEFNFYSDPKAAQIAVRSRLRKSIITLETCEQLPLTAEFVTTLARRGGKLASFVAALAQERIAASGNNKAVPLYDALAVLAVLRPHIFTFADGTADVEAELPSRLGAFSFTPGGTDGPVASVALSVNARAGYEEVFRVLETGVMLPTGSN